MVRCDVDPKEFGAKLRGKRKECKLSYQELAERCHVNHGYIRQLEAGNKLPSVSLLFIICDVLGTSPNYLFGYTEDNADKELLERIYQLTPEQKRVMLCILDAYLSLEKIETDIILPNLKKKH